MATDTATTNSAGIVNFATGRIDPTDNTAVVVTLGFKPRHIRVVNEDLVEVWEKFEGMADAATIKTVTAGTTTYDTNSGIVIGENGFTISQAAAANGDNVIWAAWG
jgi:hydrogenase maturation factor